MSEYYSTLLSAEELSLLTDELGVVEVVNLHGTTHLAHGLSGSLASLLGATAQDVVDLWDVLFKLMTTLTHGLQHIINNGVEELLALHVAQSTTTIVVFQFVEVLVFRPEVLEVIVTREGIEIGEDGVALDMARVYMERTFCHTSSAESER